MIVALSPPRAQPLNAIEPADVRSFVAKLIEDDVGARTVQLCIAVLSRVLRQAVVDGLIPANPAQGTKRLPVQRRPIRILTPEEVEGLAEAIDQRYRALVLTAAYAGLRFGEVAALRRGRVHVLERRIEVAEGVTDVGGTVSIGPLKTEESRRTVTIPAFLAEELAGHMAHHVEGDDMMALLFTAPDGGPIRRTNFRRRFWLPAVAAAGLDPAPKFHHLRHTAAALAIAQGAHPKAIQARLGHASISTTLDLYGGLFPHLDEELAERLDAVRFRAAEGLRNDSPAVVAPLASKRR